VKNGFSFVLAPPEISGIHPADGPTTGGTKLTITGRNLGLDADSEPQMEVMVGREKCLDVEWISPSETHCKLPPGAGKKLAVHVKVGKLLSKQSDITFDYNGPAIQSVEPAYGNGGMTITVMGKGFGSTDLKPFVIVGSHRCAGTKWLSDSKLLCKIAQHTAGVYNIQVVVDRQSTTQPNALEVIAPKIAAIEPKQGGAVGGETITIHGAGFATTTFFSNTDASIDGRPCQTTTVVGQSKVLCVVPKALKNIDGKAEVTVNVAGVEAKFQQGFVEMGIEVTRVEPSAVDAAGHALVTVRGNYFGTVRTTPVVHIGETLCTKATWVDDHRITCVVPSGMKSGLYGVSIRVNGLRGEKVGLLTLQPPAISRIEPKAAASVGGEMITLFGSDFGTYDTKPTVSIGDARCVATTWVNSGVVTCKVPRTKAGESAQVKLKVGRNVVVMAHGVQSNGATISRLSPTHATPKGGQVLTIHGSNFGLGKAKLSATVGNKPCSHAKWHSDSLVTCRVPRGLGVNLTVSVFIGGIEGVLAGSFSYDRPVITKLIPAEGPATGGEITVRGANFGWSNSHPRVWLGHGEHWSKCDYAEWASDSSLTCRVPPSLTGTLSARVDVVSNLGFVADAYHVAEPSIVSIEPASAPAYGGQRITLHGKNFGHADPEASVEIGGMLCPKVIWQSDSSLSCMAPAARSGSYDVKLTLLGSARHSTIKHSAFTMHGPTITGLHPKKLPATGGVLLTIHGKYFGKSDGAVAPPTVTLSGERCSVVDWHETLLKCEVASSLAEWKDVSVHMSDNDATFLSGVYLSPPTISSLKPASLSAVGGAPLTIIGANFGPKDVHNHDSKHSHPTVLISGIKCPAEWVSDEQIVCHPPLIVGEGHKDVSVQVGENKSPHTAKLWLNGPHVKSVFPSHGPHQGGETITILGSGFGTGSRTPKISLNDTACVDPRVINDTTATCTTVATPPSKADIKMEIAAFKTARPNAYTFDWCTNSTSVYHHSHTSYNAYCAPELCSFREHDLGQMKLRFEDVHFRAPLRRAQLVLEMTLDDRSSNEASRYSIDVKLNHHDVAFNAPLKGIEHGTGGNTVYTNSKTFDNFKPFVIDIDSKTRQLLKSDDDNTFTITVHTGWFGFVVVKKAELITCS
jgi:hypothetical protein